MFQRPAISWNSPKLLGSFQRRLTDKPVHALPTSVLIRKYRALVLRSRWAFFWAIETAYGSSRSPRPEALLPNIFPSPRDAALEGLSMLN